MLSFLRLGVLCHASSPPHSAISKIHAAYVLESEVADATEKQAASGLVTVRLG